ncbi:hypothetical protein RIVM261_075900 [Rivularia sp. IAM M-261]|nr:hypothetical protein RIVM261_075900 [Rivularia sp. IAM M-261]
MFTHLFCEGIKTGLGGKATNNGLITVSDIISYIRDELQRNPKFLNYLQHPVFGIDKADKDIWITRNITGKKDNQENQNLDVEFVKSYDELKVLYELNAHVLHPCVNCQIQDLNLDLIEQYSEKIEPGLYHNNDLEKILETLTLYSPIPYNGRKFLHKSAVLCFHKKPHLLFPQARSIFVAGNSGSQEFLREDVYGSLSYQIQQLIQKVEKHTNKISYINTDGTRREIPDIDYIVARELISNAIRRAKNFRGAVNMNCQSLKSACKHHQHLKATLNKYFF